MAQQKLKIQNGATSFDKMFDEEINLQYTINTPSVSLLHSAYNSISEKESHLDWNHLDKKRCYSLLDKALLFDEGRYNPLNQKIISPEQKFELELAKPEFAYDYGEHGKGYLKLRGTIDLIIEEDEAYHLIDYKTGKRYDWGKDKEKTHIDLNSDFQLCLYYYIAKKLYPDKDIFFTIYYIDFDEPITLMFDDNTLKLTEKMLKKRFDTIKNSFSPERKITWKCTKLCHFGKNTLDNEKTMDYNESMCSSLSTELKQIGLTKLWEKRATDKKFETYSGGGKSNVNIRGESVDETRPTT